MRNALEKKLGYSIPDELNNLLNEDENKYSTLEFFRILTDGYKYEAGMSHFSTYQTFWADNEYRDYLEDFQENEELDDSYVQSEYLYIIGETNGGNNQICMALHGIHTGKIYICDNGDYGITLQANTLQEFLNSLYTCDEAIFSYEELTQSVVDRDLNSLKDTMKNWILELDKKIELKKEIIALNFDIAEPYEICLIGTSEYSENDEDWACYDELEASHTSLKLFELLNTKIEWEELLNVITTILKELVTELDIKLFSVKHITTGFVDGNLEIVK